MRAIVWATRYFREQLRGHRFILFTDHKPLATCAEAQGKSLTDWSCSPWSSTSSVSTRRKAPPRLPTSYLWVGTSDTLNWADTLQHGRVPKPGSRNSGSYWILSHRALAQFPQPTHAAVHATKRILLHDRHPPPILAAHQCSLANPKSALRPQLSMPRHLARGPRQLPGRAQCHRKNTGTNHDFLVVGVHEIWRHQAHPAVFQLPKNSKKCYQAGHPGPFANPNRAQSKSPCESLQATQILGPQQACVLHDRRLLQDRLGGTNIRQRSRYHDPYDPGPLGLLVCTSDTNPLWWG